jgi:hypothetical protein
LSFILVPEFFIDKLLLHIWRQCFKTPVQSHCEFCTIFSQACERVLVSNWNNKGGIENFKIYKIYINEETFFYIMCQVLIHIHLQTSRTIFNLEFLSIPSWTLLQPKISEIKSEVFFPTKFGYYMYNWVW